MLLIEATGIGGPRLPVVLVPGMLAAGIGSLVSIGMGSFTGLDTSNYALGVLPLPELARPDFVDFVWTIPFAVAIAVVMFVILRAARELHRRIDSREFLLLPLAGLAVAGLAIAFEAITDHSVNDVLFSGEVALPGLVADAETWSAGALALVIAFKGLAWTISLASFRGGPVFPALFLGAAAGLLASHLPGFDETAAVAVGMGAATVSALGLPLSAVVLATLLTANSGAGATPLIIVGVVAAYLTTRVLSRPDRRPPPRPRPRMPEPADAPTPVDRWIDRKLSNRILRPRYAARLIAVIWLVTVIVFGIIEWIVDPESFDTVWLAFWWATPDDHDGGLWRCRPERDGRQGGRRDPDAGRAVVDLGHHRRSHERVRHPAPGRAAGGRGGPGDAGAQADRRAARANGGRARPLGFRRPELINRVSGR